MMPASGISSPGLGESLTSSVASLSADDAYATFASLDLELRGLLLGRDWLDVDSLEVRETGTLTRDHVSANATLRDLRRTGALADVTQAAQTTLLGSTLYEYSESAQPVRVADARPATSSGTNDIGRLLWRLDRVFEESNSAANTVSSDLFNTTRPRMEEPITPRRLLLGTAQSSILASARRTSRVSSATGNLSELGADGDIEQQLLNVLQAAAPASERREVDVLAEEVAAAERQHGLASTQRPEAPRSPLVGLGGADVAEVSSPTASLRSEGSDDDSWGSLGMLRQLAADGALLRRLMAADDRFAQSVRRIVQMGAVLAGAGLSEEEITALPKVKFEVQEEQQCSICLEAFKYKELLTQLPCGHFYHVECVAKWFQGSTRCPLCRSDIQT